MPKDSLIKAIKTPPSFILESFEYAYEYIDLGGKSVVAVSLGKGGFGKAYLYKKGDEYRVAKLYFSPDDHYGNVERRADSFNDIYRKIYRKMFSSLATARVIRGIQTFLDMPYIGGIDFFYKTGYEERPTRIQELLNYFIQHEFFVSDFDQPGNIVRFVDPGSNKQYILVRDVDLVGRRASFTQKGKHSVTHHILYGRHIDDGMVQNDFLQVLQASEMKEEPSDLPGEFEKIKISFLKLMDPKHPIYSALQAATTFPELCFVAAQKREKNFFSADKGLTKSLEKLLSVINKEKVPVMRGKFKLPQKVDEYDLKEVGFYGEMRVQSDSIALRKSNLQFIYSIKNNNKEFEAKLSTLRHYSLFSFDFKEIVCAESQPQPVVASSIYKPEQ